MAGCRGRLRLLVLVLGGKSRTKGRAVSGREAEGQGSMVQWSSGPAPGFPASPGPTSPAAYRPRAPSPWSPWTRSQPPHEPVNDKTRRPTCCAPACDPANPNHRRHSGLLVASTLSLYSYFCAALSLLLSHYRAPRTPPLPSTLSPRCSVLSSLVPPHRQTALLRSRRAWSTNPQHPVHLARPHSGRTVTAHPA